MIYLKEGNEPLNLAYDDEIVQEANGTYQLSFKYPVTGEHWQVLTNETFLLADDLHGEQEFFIFEVKRTHGYIQVYANQVMSLLNGYAMTSISVDRVAGQTVMTALAGSIIRQHPFSFMSDIMGRHTLNISDKSVMEALVKDKHSILGQWGGDLVREKYAVRLLQHGGSENESLFMYKKNMSSFEQAANIKNLRTRIHFKKIIQGNEGEADQVLTVTVDSPLIDKYSQIYESHQKVDDQDVTDLESLKVYAKNYYAQTLCDVAEDSIEIAVKGQSDTPVRLFDVVSVYHERYDVDLRLKISKYSYSPMRKKLKSIGFGKVGQSVGSHLSGLVNETVSAATAGLKDDFDRKLQKEIENANAAFDAEFEKNRQAINDGIEQAKAKAEVIKAEVSQAVLAVENKANQAIGTMQEASQRASEALAVAGASRNLAETARQLVTETKAGLGNLKERVDSQTRELGTKITHEEVMQRIGTVLNGYVPNSTFESYQTQSAQALTTWQRETRAMIPTSVGTSNKLSLRHLISGYRSVGNIVSDSNYVYTEFIPIENQSTYTWQIWNDTGQQVWAGHDFFDVDKRYIPKSYRSIYQASSYARYDIVPPTGAKFVTLSFSKAIMDGSIRSKFEIGSIATDWSPHPDDPLANYVQTSVFDRYQRETAEGLERRFAETKALIPTDYVNTANFHQVHETARLFERVLGRTEGEVATNIIRQVMTSELMQTEIRKIPSQIGGTNLCSLEALSSGYRSEGSITFDSNYVYTEFIPIESQSVYTWQIWNRTGKQTWAGHDFFDADKRYIPKSYRSIYQANSYGKYLVTPPSNAAFITLSFERVIRDSIIKSKFEQSSIASDWSPSPNDLASSTRVKQLADSWAVKALKGNGDVLSAINVATGGVGIISGQNKLVVTPETTYIENGTIKNAMIDSIYGGKIVAGTITGQAIGANEITATHVKVDQAFFNKLTATEAHLKQLFAQSAFITQVQAVTLSANKISGGVLKALNNAMEVNLNGGQIFYYTDKAALKRELSGYPTQFIKFATGNVVDKGPAGVTVIGSNRWGGESSDNGGFAGIRIWNGTHASGDIDSLDLVGDTIRLASSAFTDPDGWDVKTLDSSLVITPHNRAAERNSRIEVGDVWILKGDGNYSSLRHILNTFNGNFAKGPSADSFQYFPGGF